MLLELVLAHLEVDADPNLARLQLLLAASQLLEAVACELLALGQAPLAVLEPTRLLSERLGAREFSFGFGQLAFALGEELLLGAQALAPVAGEPLAFRELGLGLDHLGHPLAQLPCALGQGERALLEGRKRPAHSLVETVLDGTQLREAAFALAEIGLESFEASELRLELARAERQLGAALVELGSAALEVALERMTKPLTQPHVQTYRTGRRPPKTPFGGTAGRSPCSLLRVMKLRFLLSGLALFGVAVLLAVLPVAAQGGTAPACTIKGTSGGDLLIGTEGPDVICAYGGDDTVTAKGGDDIVRGGAGADVIYGDIGNDHLYGGRGKDRLYARDSARDWLYGGRGTDYARVDTPADVLHSIEST